MRTDNFDPLAYIESAFLDTNPKGAVRSEELEKDIDVDVPDIQKFLNGENGKVHKTKSKVATAPEEKGEKFRKTSMSAPRPRRARQAKEDRPNIDPELQETWERLPKNLEFLMGFFDDSATANYYRGEFKESREELMRRLMDPQLSLEETSRLLGVVPATVRRYTNKGWLQHYRTVGGQRRFKLSDIVKFVEEHGRFPEE